MFSLFTKVSRIQSAGVGVCGWSVCVCEFLRVLLCYRFREVGLFCFLSNALMPPRHHGVAQNSSSNPQVLTSPGTARLKQRCFFSLTIIPPGRRCVLVAADASHVVVVELRHLSVVGRIHCGSIGLAISPSASFRGARDLEPTVPQSVNDLLKP